MAFATINKGSSYFNTVLYTGTGATQSVTGVGFQPDFVWIKSRSNAYNNMLFDVLRGAGTSLFSNSTTGDEVNSPTSTTSFDSNGFSLGTNIQVNNNGSTFVNWSWKANGAGVSNTAGTISSTVSANTTSGFSIVSYTGTGANATVGHGLGVTPAMIIVKDRTNGTTSWVVWNKNFSNLTNDYIILNNTNAKGTYTNYWGTSAPTSSVFGVGSGGLDNNKSSASLIAYCFAEVKGFSKFGSYTGNGSADGTFVYTGFKPAFILIKRSDSTADWYLQDNVRNQNFNGDPKTLQPNTTSTEATIGTWSIDNLSNGFKIRESNAAVNASGGTYIYAAFAQNPFVLTDGTPVTAR
jgi:hypothetical protein